MHITESSAEFHSLNDVADRAIKSIFAHFQSDLEASGAPKAFWPFVVSHAVDILGLTTCPPHNRHTCCESLTGDKPRIISLWPWGCQAYSVNLSSHLSKTNIDSKAWEDIHLGRSTFRSSSFHIWLPSLSKLVTSSGVYLKETCMPWRKPGDRQVSSPIPFPADGDTVQSPTLPDDEIADPSVLSLIHI